MLRLALMKYGVGHWNAILESGCLPVRSIVSPTMLSARAGQDPRSAGDAISEDTGTAVARRVYEYSPCC